MTHEEAPLAFIFREVLSFLVGREDAVLHGAQAVNAYADEERMTHDLDVLSTRARELAQELKSLLAQRFHIAARVREVVPRIGFRVYQVRKPKNRHLVDVRQVADLPPSRVVEGVRVMAPVSLVASKVMASLQRRGPKVVSDILDLQRLLLAFPELKKEEGRVLSALRKSNAPDAAISLWRELVRQPLQPDRDDS